MNHDEHIASQLRWTAGTIQDSANGGNLTLSDLRAAGKIAGAYQTIYHSAAAGKGGCEAFQAPALGMVDMKTEALLQNGLVSDSMARMIQASLAQRYQNALDVSNRRLAVRQEEALSGETSIPQMDFIPSIMRCCPAFAEAMAMHWLPSKTGWPLGGKSWHRTIERIPA